MIIRIHSGEHSLSIVMPTRLLFSKGAIKLGLKIGRRYSDQIPDIPPEAVNALCAEIRRICEDTGAENRLRGCIVG